MTTSRGSKVRLSIQSVCLSVHVYHLDKVRNTIYRLNVLLGNHVYYWIVDIVLYQFYTIIIIIDIILIKK